MEASRYCHECHAWDYIQVRNEAGSGDVQERCPGIEYWKKVLGLVSSLYKHRDYEWKYWSGSKPLWK
jgi:hypothetical protein